MKLKWSEIENKIRMPLIGIFLLVAAFTLPASAATTISIGNFDISPGGMANGSLIVNNVTDFFGADINISYNPSVVIVSTVKQANPSIAITSNINNATGSTRIIADGPLTGLSGDIILANISFLAVGASGSSSELNLALNQMIDINGNDISATLINGTFNITGGPIQLFNISGFKLNSSDNKGLPGWTIRLLNITTGLELANKTTDSSGFYNFTGLANGTYNVTEVMKQGWMNVTPTSLIVTITGTDAANKNFTNALIPPAPVPTFNISGTKFNDLNGDGVRQANEPGLANWTIILKNRIGTVIAKTMTDANGNYKFQNLLAGNYTVAEVQQAGWIQTAPKPVPPGTYAVSLTGADITGLGFGNMQVPPSPRLGSISGYKINDSNGNGKWDSGEKGLSGWTIQLMGIGPETKDIRKETITNDTGFYTFDNLPVGRYLIKETLKKGFVPIGSPVKVITLKRGENSMNNNFTNRPISKLVGNKDGNDKQGNKDDNKGMDHSKTD